MYSTKLHLQRYSTTKNWILQKDASMIDLSIFDTFIYTRMYILRFFPCMFSNLGTANTVSNEVYK